MTSTPVKDMGSVLSSPGPAAGGSTKAVSDKGFQKVLNGQTDKNQEGSRTADSRTDASQKTAKKMPGESLKAKEASRARVSDAEPAQAAAEAEEIPEMELEKAMEVMGTAAMDMMQQIADAFGISIPDLEGVMGELGMDGIDVLDREKLGKLLLALGGAENEYALVTDGELYGNYRELMAGLETTLQQIGRETGLDPEKLLAAAKAQAAQTQEAEPESGIIPAERTVEVTQTVQQTQPERDRPAEQTPSREPEQTGQPAEEPVQNRQPAGDEGRTETNAGDRKEETDSGNRHPVFAQSFRTEQFQPQTGLQTGAPETAQGSWRADTQDIMRQIMDYMRVQVKPDTSSLEMQLHPESLGSLHVQVASRGGVVTASFIAQNETVKAALESQIVQLRENFEQQGVKVEAIEVTVESHAFERNLDQGRGQGSTQEQDRAARRIRTRRINLNEPANMGDLEEEDALAAEMMAASGSQVDYTA